MRAPTIPSALLASVLLLGCGPDTTWQPAYDATDTGWLMNVWGLRDDYRIAVGGSLPQGRAVRYDGASWTAVDVPEVGLLNWVYGFGEDDVWAVGANGAIVRWQGDGFVEVASPTDQDLWGVWGAAPDDVWAVGGTARMPSIAAPTVVHWDGTAWTVVETPALERTGVQAFFKVWGSGPNDVYVVGDAGVVLRWDGTSWTELFVGAPDDIVAIWGTGPDDIVAVGGRLNGFVSRWDGTEWRSELLDAMPGLNGIWMRRPGVAHIVGLRATLLTMDADTFEFTEEPVDERHDFHAIQGVDGRVVAVGGNLAVPSDPVGIAWTRELRDDE